MVEAAFHIPPAPQVADGFQLAVFVSPRVRNLHLEKACFLVESRAVTISFHAGLGLDLFGFLLFGTL